MRPGLILSYIIITVCALRPGAQTLTSTYVEYADSADRYIRHERWQDAERMIIKALRHEPANKSNYLLWNNLGLVRGELGNLEGAREAFDIGLASAPNSTQLLAGRARVYLKENKQQEALADLDRALSLDSTLQWPLKIRGLLMLEKQNPKEAIRNFDEYLRHYKEEATVLTGAGDAHAMLGHAEEAATFYRRAAEADKEDPVPLEKLLLLAYTDGKLDDEEKTIRDALKRFPRHAMFYLLRGALHRQRYQTEEMETDRRLAIEYGADPQTVEIFLPKKRK